MKIAVEIPDVIYKKLINGEIHFGGITSKNIFNYVKNGTPIELPEKTEESDDYGKSLIDLHKRIDTLPIITSKPKKGHWTKEKSLHGWDGKSYQCSVCGRSIHIDPEVEDLTDYPYCHCGAIMIDRQEGEIDE